MYTVCRACVHLVELVMALLLLFLPCLLLFLVMLVLSCVGTFGYCCCVCLKGQLQNERIIQLFTSNVLNP